MAGVFLNTKTRRFTVYTFIFLTMFFVVGSNKISVSAKMKYKTYYNSNFQYSMKYPSEFVEEDYPQNGDGVWMWTENHDAELSMYGSYNTEQDNGYSYYNNYCKQYESKEEFSYKTGKKYVKMSYKENGKIVHRYEYLTKDILAGFEIRYLPEHNSHYKKVIRTMEKSVEIKSKETKSKTNWKHLYSEYLETLSESEFPEGVLIYVNNDKIPELFLQGNCSATGNLLLTIYNGKVYKNNMDGVFMYLSKKNRYYITGGNMDVYYDLVGKLEKGNMVNIAEGHYGAEDNANVKFDKNSESIYKYFWNNKKVSEKEYKKKLNHALGKKRKEYKDAYIYGHMKTIHEIKYALGD